MQIRGIQRGSQKDDTCIRTGDGLKRYLILGAARLGVPSPSNALVNARVVLYPSNSPRGEQCTTIGHFGNQISPSLSSAFISTCPSPFYHFSSSAVALRFSPKSPSKWKFCTMGFLGIDCKNNHPQRNREKHQFFRSCQSSVSWLFCSSFPHFQNFML